MVTSPQRRTYSPSLLLRGDPFLLETAVPLNLKYTPKTTGPYTCIARLLRVYGQLPWKPNGVVLSLYRARTAAHSQECLDI